MSHCLEHGFSFGRCGMYVSIDDIVFCSKRFLVCDNITQMIPPVSLK